MGEDDWLDAEMEDRMSGGGQWWGEDPELFDVQSIDFEDDWEDED